MKLKPWRQVIDPREDLREGKALDTAEFAVHLDMVHDKRGYELYWKPEQFFARTYLTKSLLDLAAETVRRLSGIQEATSAIFNMTTQFGGGKTHALTLLYHLAQNGPAANRWVGVPRILQQAGVDRIPQARVAVFVGMRFDARGGDDGTPYRRTPWGEIAWQLAGDAGFQLLASFDAEGRAPGGDTIARLFALVNQPVLILMDELINYVSRYRQGGLGAQLYNFLFTLAEETRAHANVVLAVSIPISEGEMTAEDVEDYRRFSKMLDRLGKAVIMSAEADTSEIIRRRLFEWDERALDVQGRVILPKEAIAACRAYADWVQENRQQLPGWFAADTALDAFKATYPFHPALISVFQRKWQGLPSFQRTRGILRLLALWVARAHQDAYQSAHRDPLIGLGTAPLEDPVFRTAVFKQLGEDNLETAVTTDIVGGRSAHAERLDADAVADIKQARLHRKVATAIFFESNGGQLRAFTTIPEIRLAVAEPGLDIGHVETVLEALAPPDGACFYLDVIKNRYWFSMKPNLTQVLADRKAALDGDPRIMESVKEEIQAQFGKLDGVNRIFFPEKSSNIPNQTAVTVVIVSPEQTLQDKAETLAFMEQMTREYGSAARTYKNALIWAVAENAAPMKGAAQKLLAWETIDDEAAELQLGATQQEQLKRNLGRAKGDLKEAVWRAYNRAYLLGKDNRLKEVDLGRHNSSSAANLLTLIIRELRKYGDVEESISPGYLVRNWPPAFTEWSTKGVRDALYASPQFPRLLDANAIRETIAKGVTNGFLAYLGKPGDGRYQPFYFREALGPADIEIAEDMFIITRETAEAYVARQAQAASETAVVEREKLIKERGPGFETEKERERETAVAPEVVTAVDKPVAGGTEPPDSQRITKLTWRGEIAAQKWVNFYMKVLTKFASDHELKLALHVEVAGDSGISPQKVEEMQAALRELGLEDRVGTG
jgi:hypothetical protein